MILAICFLTVLSASQVLVSGEKILLLPTPYSSHVGYFKVLGDELRDKYDHDIYMVLPPSYPKLMQALSWNMTIITYDIKEADFYQQDLQSSPEEMQQFWIEIAEKGPIWDLRNNIKEVMPFCTNPLEDKHLFQTLKDLKLDLSIIDAFPQYRVLVILLYRLGVPYVSLTTQYEPWLFRNPSLPSFVPFPLGTVYTDKMDFLQRLWNTILLLDWYVFPRMPYLEDSLVTKYAPEMPFQTLNYLIGRSQLWLLNSDTVLDYARPTMANVIEVGGLTTKPGKKLNTEIEDLLEKGNKGFIVVSFGSIAESLPFYIMQQFADAFIKFPDYTIIWKFGQDKNRPAIKNVASNVKMLEWIPQNDLLADDRTRLFVTHCGNNGQFEAMYHGVPMVGIPLFGDQPANAARIQYREYGIGIPFKEFTPEVLAKAMKTVLGDSKYKSNIQKASEIFRDREHPLERAGYWVDHVIQFGGDHLHSYALDMPWYEYLMLDILGFILLVLIIVLFILAKFCQFVLRLIYGSSKEKLKTQ